MPTVKFESTSIVVEVPNGGALQDVCDAHDSPVPFSCRSANCGTCRIEVLEGADLILPPEDEELDILDVFSLKAPKFRLACQSKLKPGGGVVRVKPAED
ncbi:MAG: (2Fe-2S)-binding protein [Polyangiaceae bacterium]|nr:(2Fe-2S)-binding protein [Polyangiaceae bacterium]